MDYSILMTAVQAAGLCLLGGSAVALLRLVTIHFVQHDWNAEHGRTLLALTGLQSAGLLLFAFSGGGHFAIAFFQTNNLPSLPLLATQLVLMAVLSASVVFLHVIARPWLTGEDSDNGMVERPLVVMLGAHRMLAMTLAFSAFASAWSLWLVIVSPGTAPTAAQVLAALALLTLLLWSLLALPALVLRAAALYTLRDKQPVTAAVRTMPFMSEMPEHRIAHVPARRAPRPLLEPQDNYLND